MIINDIKSKIYVFGEFDSANIGDVLIGLGQEFVYKQCNLDAEMVSLELSSRKCVKNNISNEKVTKLRRLHRFFYKNSFYYRHLLESIDFFLKRNVYFAHALKSIYGSNVVVIGGGQLFNDNSLRMILRIYCLLKLSKDKKIKTYIVGSGMPRPKTFISKFITKRALSLLLVENVFFRDLKSINVANEYYFLGLTENNIIPDFAISYINQFSMPTLSIKKRVGLAPISLDVIPKSHLNLKSNQNDWWIELSQYLVAKDIQPVFFCSGSIEDFSRCLDIQKLALKKGVRLELLTRPLDSETFIDYINEMDNVIAQRLHVSITSYSLMKKPVSLPWDDKVKCFYEEIGMPSHHLIKDEVPFETIYKMLSNDNVEPIPPKVFIKKSSSMIKKLFS